MKLAKLGRHIFLAKLSYKAYTYYSQPIIQSITVAGVSCIISYFVGLSEICQAEIAVHCKQGLKLGGIIIKMAKSVQLTLDIARLLDLNGHNVSRIIAESKQNNK